MDNKFLAKFSTTLRNPAAALTLLVDTCFLLDPRIVRVSYHKGDYGRGMLRVAAEAAGATLELSEL